MKTDILPVLLWILHTEDPDLRHIAAITRPDIFDGATTDFHDDGLWSTRIFGMVGSPERDTTYGKIDMGVRILHPKIYRDLTSLRELYKQIINGTASAIFDEQTGDYIASNDEGAETGFSFFMRNMPKLKLKRSNSIARNKRIEFIERWKHRWTMKNLVVMPAGLRDVEIGADGRPTKHEINDFYYQILAISQTITPSRDMESPAYDTARRALQNQVNALYDYLDNTFGGKNGFLKDKWASRRIREGTRNVLTSMPTTGIHLDSPNVPGFDATVMGVYQTASSMAPLTIHWLRTTFLAKLMAAGEGDVPLVDPKTLKLTWVPLSPLERDSFTTEDGLREVIHSMIDVDARHRPVTIAGKYLALVYLGEGTFKVFDSIDELPADKSKDDVHPMTLIEMIYLAGYSKWGKYFTDVVRYPVAGDDSTYPSRIYCKTTSVGDVRRELDNNWEPMEGDDYLAVEFPRFGLTTYHDSECPHPSRLGGLDADFDGDMGSATTAMLKESRLEIERYLKTRAAWVDPAGRMRASVTYDTAELVVRNLTGRFDHVENVVHTLG